MEKNIQKRNKRKKGLRAILLWTTLCLALLCGAMPATAASGKPGKVKIVSVKRKKNGRAQVKYKPVSGADGYQIMFATNRKFTDSFVVTVKKGKTASKTVKGLRADAKYYVRIRAYRKSGGKKRYGKWGSVAVLKAQPGALPEYQESSSPVWSVVGVTGSGNTGENGYPSQETVTAPSLPYVPETEPDDEEKDLEATAWGFSLSSYSYDDLYKVEDGARASRTEDGGHIYTADFLCDGGENWLKDVEFELEDVTPDAYKKMYAAMNVPGGVSSHSQKINNPEVSGYVPRVLEPLDDSPYTQPVEMNIAVSCIELTVHAKMATRALKVTAKKGGRVLDTIYLTASERNPQNANQYVSQDEQLYREVRRKVEQKLWKPGMTNLEKLQALQRYINTTAHYPGKDTTSPKYNPTFWKEWSVDGIGLYDDLADDVMLNKTMALQGGTTTCQADTILLRVATEDLGLKGIANTKIGEGVWIGMGSASSNTNNPWHETFYYQDSEGHEHYLDTQGMMYSRSSGLVTCESHKCKDKIVSLY